MSGLRTLWRGLRVIEHLATGALLSLHVGALARLGRRPTWMPRLVRWWHARLCRTLGVLVLASGRPAGGALLVANHVSWLDVPVLGSLSELGFLAKSEVRRWPLLGWMAATADTLFIQRGGHQAGSVRAQIAAGIARGRGLVIFPEGTTSDGTGVGRFHPRLFAVAQGPGIGVQPVGIRYRGDSGPGPDTSVAYVGDDTLVASLWRVMRHPRLVAEVSFLPVLEPFAGEDRRSIAARARDQIVAALAAGDCRAGDEAQPNRERRPYREPDPVGGSRLDRCTGAGV